MPKQIRKRRSNPFTLLELFLCIAILGIAASVVGVNIKGLYDRHTLESSARRLTTKLRELQALALSYQTDMALEIVQDERGLTYKAITDESIRGFDHKRTALKDKCAFIFDGKRPKQLMLEISPTGWMEPHGILEIQRKGGSSLWIDLRHPLLITLAKQQPDKDKTFTIPASLD